MKDQPNLSVSIYVRDSDVAQSIVKAFKNVLSTAPVELYDGREVSISRVLANAGQLPVVLRELNREFCTLWTKAGGLGKFLKL